MSVLSQGLAVPKSSGRGWLFLGGHAVAGSLCTFKTGITACFTEQRDAALDLLAAT